MQESDVLLSCHGCKEKFSLPKLFYNKDTKELLCGECRKTEDLPVTPRKQTLSSTGPRMHEGGEAIRYVCRSCAYAFFKPEGILPTKCSYCESTELDIDVGLQKDAEKEKLLMDLYG